MSKRAEEAAWEAYPDYHSMDGGYVTQRKPRTHYIQGYEQAEKELTPLINQLCEAILFEWKDAADLARKTLTQIKAREEE